MLQRSLHILYLLFVYLAISLLGCDQSNFTSAPHSENEKVQAKVGRPILPQEAILKFGTMGSLYGNAYLIPNYGPTAEGPTGGWDGIYIDTRWHPDDDSDFTAAQNAGYYPILANIGRDDIVNANWSNVDAQITFGNARGATYFYVDDALSMGSIEKWKIDIVAAKVHAINKMLATAEYDQNLMAANPNWHDNVDIIMPYNYWAANPAELDAFFWWVRSHYPSKQLIPFLGYNVWSSYYQQYFTQTGALGGGTGGYIEVAKKYSSLIFYYNEGGLTAFNQLTTYLRQYYGLQY